MCNAFSCLIHRDGKVYWKAGIDSHSNLVEHFRLKDDKKELDADFVKVELTPDEGYLHPEGRWTPKIDQGQTPHWWKDSMLMRADKALEEWKQEVYSKIDLEGARNPVKPWEIEPRRLGKSRLALLKEWASVWDSVWASVGASVWASVGASVWASVGASVGDSVWDSVWDSVVGLGGGLGRGLGGASVGTRSGPRSGTRSMLTSVPSSQISATGNTPRRSRASPRENIPSGRPSPSGSRASSPSRPRRAGLSTIRSEERTP